MIRDEDLRKNDLTDLLDVLMDAHAEGEGPLTTAQVQRRLAIHPRIQRDLSQERIDCTLTWGLHQPYVVDHPGQISKTKDNRWLATPRWGGR